MSTSRQILPRKEQGHTLVDRPRRLRSTTWIEIAPVELVTPVLETSIAETTTATSPLQCACNDPRCPSQRGGHCYGPPGQLLIETHSSSITMPPAALPSLQRVLPACVPLSLDLIAAHVKANQAITKGQWLTSTVSVRNIKPISHEGVTYTISSHCESEYRATKKVYETQVALSAEGILSSSCVCIGARRGKCKHISTLLHSLLLLQQRPQSPPRWARRSQRTVRNYQGITDPKILEQHRLWTWDRCLAEMDNEWPEKPQILTTQVPLPQRGRTKRARATTSEPLQPTQIPRID